MTVLLDGSFAGEWAKFGFEEVLFNVKNDLADNETTKSPIKEHAELILNADMLSNKSPLERLQDNRGMVEFVAKISDYIVNSHATLVAAIDRIRPDLFVVDNFLVPPAILRADIPWIFLCSSNPLLILESPNLPPSGSGYASTIDNRPKWEEYRRLEQQVYGGFYYRAQKKLCQCLGYLPTDADLAFRKPNAANNEVYFMLHSPWLNVLNYPRELDYQDIEPLGEKFAAVDTLCEFDSTTPKSFELPKEFADLPSKDGKIIYFSLGSMGSIDLALVKRVCLILAQTPYKVIVSKGPLGDEYDLPPNCWGQPYLPQTKILSMDSLALVITHGGNNTVTGEIDLCEKSVALIISFAFTYRGVCARQAYDLFTSL